MGPGGYAWWYVDAVSACGQHGLTLIAFVGSVFSPWYAWSGRGWPENHVSLNAVFYSPGKDRWTMTERSAAQLRRDARTLAIGPSALTWDGDDLLIRIDEWTAPVPPMPTAPSRVLGAVRVTPGALNRESFTLDAAGRHVWRPIAPRAHVEVRMREPDLNWRGEGYLDTNAGTEPPEEAFTTWHWSRAHLRRDSAVLYDLERADGSDLTLALRFDAQGRAEALEPPPAATLPPTACWRMPRRSRADAGAGISVRRTWEDTPFYARTAIDTTLFGEPATGVHESLSLRRLRSPLVRSLLAFRMPRAIR